MMAALKRVKPLPACLPSRQVLLERNKFPYELPPGAEHWTIWSRPGSGPKAIKEVYY
jgi:hypothetical protein